MFIFINSQSHYAIVKQRGEPGFMSVGHSEYKLNDWGWLVIRLGRGCFLFADMFRAA
jgi:hypothetical protein